VSGSGSHATLADPGMGGPFLHWRKIVAGGRLHAAVTKHTDTHAIITSSVTW